MCAISCIQTVPRKPWLIVHKRSFFSPSKGHALKSRIRKKEEKDVRHPHMSVFIAKNPSSGETHSNMNQQKFIGGTIVVISKWTQSRTHPILSKWNCNIMHINYKGVYGPHGLSPSAKPNLRLNPSIVRSNLAHLKASTCVLNIHAKPYQAFKHS